MTPTASPLTDQRSPARDSEDAPQWRVSPSPDGRGAEPAVKPPLLPPNRRWWALLAGFLVLNLLSPRARWTVSPA